MHSSINKLEISVYALGCYVWLNNNVNLGLLTKKIRENR